MRVLFTTQPGHGHLDPMLPYARELRKAGHEVRVASTAAFGRTIEAAGFPAVPIGPDFLWESVDELDPRFLEFARAGRAMEYAVEFTWTRWNISAARDLLASCDSWRPDLFVREFAENGATFAGAAAGIPVACASWAALPTDSARWSTVLDWERVLGHYVTAGAATGLESESPGALWDRQLTLTGLPPSWFTTTAYHDANVRHFRLTLSETTNPRPQWLDSLGQDRPLVYATLGTVVNRRRRLRSAVLEAMATLDADVVMTVGNNVDPATVGPIPANVRIERFVPQAHVLSRASLVVCHAGLGTMLGALYHGVPMVTIPVGAEQPINAQAAADAGVGVPLGMDDASASAIAAVAAGALTEPSLRAKSDEIRRECEALRPLDQLPGLLERYASEPLPA